MRLTLGVGIALSMFGLAVGAFRWWFVGRRSRADHESETRRIVTTVVALWVVFLAGVAAAAVTDQVSGGEAAGYAASVSVVTGLVLVGALYTKQHGGGDPSKMGWLQTLLIVIVILILAALAIAFYARPPP